jgi:hypothetical protein
LGESVREVLRYAEDSASALQRALFELARHALAPGDRVPDPKDRRQLVDSFGSGARFWSQAKRHFDRYLERMVGDEVEARAVFAREIRREARSALNEASAGLGASARALKASTLAARLLARGLPTVPELKPLEATSS